MKPILEIQNISKRFSISHQSGGYLSLRERLGNAFKFERQLTEEFWALKEVSFDVQPGESVGIIGRNGAGKSTLLKILSKITPPTDGKIISRGRIASLLEVGTGFHPELTGRENVFFNGSLLGMKRKEIESKFDEIVDFSGVEKFLDTPLKHYSSGMQLRLAFAVAAFLEPEILIIDEVLAVGDAEFQKKCMGKMSEVSLKEGRTILFVSHNISAIQSLCKKGVLINSGQIMETGPMDIVISRYYNELKQYEFSKDIHHQAFSITQFRMLNEKGKEIVTFNTFDSVTFRLNYRCNKETEDFSFAVCFNNPGGLRVTSLWSLFKDKKYTLMPGDGSISIEVPAIKLIPGTYEIILYAESNGKILERIDNFKNIVVGFNANENGGIQPTESHAVYLEEFNVLWNE